jgi:hypothetical protein
MTQFKLSLFGWITENGSYKLVALFVTMILWVTILGRRDFVVSRDMNLELVLPPGYVLVEPHPLPQVQIKVVGSRVALKRFAQTSGLIVVELNRGAEGLRHVLLSPENLELPIGVKLLSMNPSRVTVEIAKSAEAPSDGSKKQ